MNQSAWLTMTTQCEKLQVLTLRTPPLDAPLTEAIHGRIAAAMSTQETVKDTITNKLREAFAPESLDVTDESHLHEGHAGHRPGGETPFRIYIVAPALDGESTIARTPNYE